VLSQEDASLKFGALFKGSDTEGEVDRLAGKKPMDAFDQPFNNGARPTTSARKRCLDVLLCRHLFMREKQSVHLGAINRFLPDDAENPKSGGHQRV
jgi:hypothetical protein